MENITLTNIEKKYDFFTSVSTAQVRTYMCLKVLFGMETFKCNSQNYLLYPPDAYFGLAFATQPLRVEIFSTLTEGGRSNLLMGDMYNRYACPLQPGRHLTLKLFIQGHPRRAKVPM